MESDSRHHRPRPTGRGSRRARPTGRGSRRARPTGREFRRARRAGRTGPVAGAVALVVGAALVAAVSLCGAALLGMIDPPAAARSGDRSGGPGRSVGLPAHSDRFVTPEQLDRATAGAAPVARRVVASLGGGPASAATKESPVGARGVGGVRAAIVPHHLVAGHLAAGLLAALAERPPETVVIVGPDHFGAGPAVGTCRAAWNTAVGRVEADTDLVSALVARGAAVEAWDVLEREHSVGALVPLVKRYFPEVRVVPLTVRAGVSFERAAALGRLLAELAPGRGAAAGGGVLVIASVDFSHYLPRAEADRRDELTLQALRNGDWDVLFAMGPAHLDSAAALAVAFAFAGCAEAPRFEVVWHDNSAAVLGRPNLAETTSYFLLVIP
ncbi:MAG: AmmeMemoRadiSam system protein B [Bacillota bacterium]